MAERKLNLNIEKGVSEFEAIAKKLNLNAIKRTDSEKKYQGASSNKKFGKGINLKEMQSLLKKWKKIFNAFLIFSVIVVIVMIFVISSYYKTSIQEQEEIAQNDSSYYISNLIHLTSKLNNSFFSLTNFTKIPEKNIQSIVIVNDEECTPDIVCKYVGYMREYDLSTVIDGDFLLDKKVISCHDSSNCVSNFTYLESSKELFSRQAIRVKRAEVNKIDIYDENDVFIAEIEKKDLGYIEQLYIWFKF